MGRRIALISEHASPLADLGGVDAGGQNVYVAHLARQLAKLGHGVDVFTRRDRLDLPDTLEADGFRVIHVPAGPARYVRKEDMLPLMTPFAQFMADWCRSRGSYDVVHANFWMSGLVALNLKRALGIPFVVTFHALGHVRLIHQGEADDFPRARLSIEKAVVDEADRVIGECPQDVADLVRFYGADRARLAMIPAGFDPDELYPVPKGYARRLLGLPRRERIILQLGRVVPRKGIDNVIRGLACLVRSELIEAKLLIVGGDSERPDPRSTPEIGRLARIASEEGVGDRVFFNGRERRSRLKYFYAAADVFVTTPWYEPFGMTPLEAMACGRPVVGSNVGGIKYTVQEGRTGLLVPANEPALLAQRLAYLYRRPWLLRWFGWRGVWRASHFTWARVARRCGELYEAILAETNVPSGLPR